MNGMKTVKVTREFDVLNAVGLTGLYERDENRTSLPALPVGFQRLD